MKPMPEGMQQNTHFEYEVEVQKVRASVFPPASSSYSDTTSSSSSSSSPMNHPMSTFPDGAPSVHQVLQRVMESLNGQDLDNGPIRRVDGANHPGVPGAQRLAGTPRTRCSVSADDP
ncbi:hypothetical protein C2857_000194 [Epichloe festucae Fl1]|uniref:Uncharacterized protein n=1 Tax=Epichloe festucae (strain Fl1) TaxID=877507 RepID=A0A7S9PW90_EPIFF|nr:hypothetical protein C2857_000194 [Epichloe festucae Fl1]